MSSDRSAQRSQLRNFGLAGSQDTLIEAVDRLAKFAGKQLGLLRPTICSS
ncbi:MAG: hypothetical protein V5B30_05305 [Candidatus Accumulibacter delftensis]